MKASELRELSKEELHRKVAELRDELFRLKLRRTTEQLPNPVRLRVLRREIARCLTVLKEKESKEGGSNA
ncbi:MAG: 50S ribosomal protein L29 [candidate division WOR-3 bacterium]|jgi:large subunit ribosomal protein L29|nr:50S ribosomal protein L29 [candidate division WOR-3 bacterium]MCR4423411.1 50S ribosomal protein L29 [candidate division WOR-3 bacterium]MDH7518750.1 50S ribosomal protein L29 [bacterium]